jgi:hypothetical protein
MAHDSADDQVTRQPRYQGSDANAGAKEQLTARQRRTRLLVIAIVIAALLAMVILHVTGILGKGMN